MTVKEFAHINGSNHLFITTWKKHPDDDGVMQAEAIEVDYTLPFNLYPLHKYSSITATPNAIQSAVITNITASVDRDGHSVVYIDADEARFIDFLREEVNI